VRVEGAGILALELLFVHSVKISPDLFGIEGKNDRSALK
jgi:hypothetical protein